VSRWAIGAALVLSGWLCAGCVLSRTTDGTKIFEESVARIVVGESTRQDVAKLLGAPDDIIYSNFEHDPLFERAFSYRRNLRKTTYFTLILFSASRSDSNSDHVVVFFDDEGVVEDVASRLDMDRAHYGAPWGDSE
jgi:outer membrane protein assembly factor BamE (lipoprotein component of BamABCDE complex)